MSQQAQSAPQPRRPKGAVRVIGFARGTEAHPHIVAPTVICEDEAGVRWEYVAAYSVAELEPHGVSQSESLQDWRRQLNAAISTETHVWTVREKVTDGWVEQAYRRGLTVQKALSELKLL